MFGLRPALQVDLTQSENRQYCSPAFYIDPLTCVNACFAALSFSVRLCMPVARQSFQCLPCYCPHRVHTVWKGNYKVTVADALKGVVVFFYSFIQFYNQLVVFVYKTAVQIIVLIVHNSANVTVWITHFCTSSHLPSVRRNASARWRAVACHVAFLPLQRAKSHPPTIMLVFASSPFSASCMALRSLQ
ncbi:hypothetical protein UFOVP742_26 [uncultured Caudovirales phage]|uniref:Uncharacterized protein n=1 Tax=uncultured Caudovirales phage TaxID=2100421 RepID=A0A6J7X637_9CAUD|nr:hypothetical protein UFOVP742_26 [uncultured Caudovirales phage]